MGLIDQVRSWLAARKAREELADLEQRALEATASFRPQYNLRAARLAHTLDQDSRALELYGAAIDGFLESGRGRAAEVACREVVERYPQVVRARRTLALLALGRDDDREATTLLSDYAEVAKQYGDTELIRKSLRTMGMISQPGPVRERAAAELSALGDEDGASMVLEDKSVVDDAVFGGAHGPWSKALHAALLGADELRKLRAN